MSADRDREEQIQMAWRHNAAPWVQAVRNHTIESRVRVTDAAIVDTVLGDQPKTVLDVGCGEGWLCRALQAHGIATLGIDMEPALVAAAKAAAPGHDYRTTEYRHITTALGHHRFDLAVCNFSLLGDQSVARLLEALGSLVTLGNRNLIIQTLHPHSAFGSSAYKDGWRAGSWQGLGNGFGEAAPWYFRTLGSWVALLHTHRWSIHQLHEPLDETTGRPASLIIHARRQAPAGDPTEVK